MMGTEIERSSMIFQMPKSVAALEEEKTVEDGQPLEIKVKLKIIFQILTF